MTTMIDMQVQ